MTNLKYQNIRQLKYTKSQILNLIKFFIYQGGKEPEGITTEWLKPIEDGYSLINLGMNAIIIEMEEYGSGVKNVK